MLQRAFYLLHDRLDLDQLFRLTEHRLSTPCGKRPELDPAGELLDGLFGRTRRLYKRVAEFSFFENRELYEQTRAAAVPVAGGLRGGTGEPAQPPTRPGACAPHEVLFDAPPVKREVEFQIDVFFREGTACIAAWRSFARGATRWPSAVRRLRETRAGVRPPAHSQRRAATGFPAGTHQHRSGERGGVRSFAVRRLVVAFLSIDVMAPTNCVSGAERF